MTVIGSVVCIILALLLAVAIDLALHARRALASLARQESLLETLIYSLTPPSASGSHKMTAGLDGGFSVWVYRGGRWDLSDDFSREGFEPGPPPPHLGTFEGEAVRKVSVRRGR